VGALVFVRQINIHVDVGYGVLIAVFFVKNPDRVTKIFDPDLVNWNSAVIPFVLRVLDRTANILGGFE
jgi:hypothetical protein